MEKLRGEALKNDDDVRKFGGEFKSSRKSRGEALENAKFGNFGENSKVQVQSMKSRE